MVANNNKIKTLKTLTRMEYMVHKQMLGDVQTFKYIQKIKKKIHLSILVFSNI